MAQLKGRQSRALSRTYSSSVYLHEKRSPAKLVHELAEMELALDLKPSPFFFGCSVWEDMTREGRGQLLASLQGLTLTDSQSASFFFKQKHTLGACLRFFAK